VIALKNTQQLVAQFSATELRAAIRDEQVGNVFGVILGLFSSGGAPASSDDRSKLVHLLELRRQRYGGEVLLSSFDRDRSAEEFNTLIEDWKASYS